MDKELIKAFLKDIIIKEGLTPDQSSKVMSKYDSIYKGMLKGDKKKLMKYTDPKFNRPNPDAMAMGRAINLVKKDSLDEIEKDRFAGEDPRAGSTIKGRGFDWEKNNSQEIVIYNGEEHEVMRRVDDELGKRIYIRPKEESAILGKKNLFWVKPEDLEESVNEAGFQKMSQSQFKLRTAIKDQEKQNRLAKDDSEFPAGDLHKILISKVLGRGELDPKYDKTYKALLKKFDLVESLNEARTDLEREYNQYDSFTLDGEVYMIKDIEEYPGNKVQITTEPSQTRDHLTGDSRKSKIFFSNTILKMGGEFHKKERKKRTTQAWNKGQKSTTRRQYERILKGAMRDAAGMGDEEFTYDMATSMIYDPEISSYLDKEYPRLGRNGKIERLQSDLEMYIQESVNEITPAQQRYVDMAASKPSKPKKTQFRKDIEGAKRMMDAGSASDEQIISKYGIAAFNAVNAENEYLQEKKLTKAEKDKKEDIIMSMKKKKGGKDKLTDKDYAIATSTAKKVAETKLTELIKSALKNPTKSTNEGMSDQEWSKAKEKERLEKHPEKDTIKKIQTLVAKEKTQSESVNGSVLKDKIDRDNLRKIDHKLHELSNRLGGSMRIQLIYDPLFTHAVYGVNPDERAYVMDELNKIGAKNYKTLKAQMAGTLIIVFDASNILSNTAGEMNRNNLAERILKKLREGKEERTSTVSKSRAKAEVKDIEKGKRSDGMGKPTDKVYAVKDGKEIELKTLKDFNKHSSGYTYKLK